MFPKSDFNSVQKKKKKGKYLLEAKSPLVYVLGRGAPYLPGLVGY